MLRTGIILAVVGLLVADPILCRAAHATAPCPGHGRALSATCPGHPEPHESGEESAHSCICRGATSDTTTKQRTQEASADAAALLCATLATSLPAPTGHLSLPPSAASGPPTGRSICIVKQTLLI